MQTVVILISDKLKTKHAQFNQIYDSKLPIKNDRIFFPFIFMNRVSIFQLNCVYVLQKIKDTYLYQKFNNGKRNFF